MPRIKKFYKNHFTIIDNYVLEDKSLSWKAKGLFAYLWSQSDNWNFYEKEVVKHSTDGISGLRSGLNELEQAGYLNRKRRRIKGKLKESLWILSEKPKLDFLKQEKLKLEKLKLENQTLTSTNLNKNQNKISTNSNKSSSVKKEEDATRLKIYQKFLDSIRKESFDPSIRVKPTSDEHKQIMSLIKQLQPESLQAIILKLQEYTHAGTLYKPWPYLLKMMRDALKNEKFGGDQQ